MLRKGLRSLLRRILRRTRRVCLICGLGALATSVTLLAQAPLNKATAQGGFDFERMYNLVWARGWPDVMNVRAAAIMHLQLEWPVPARQGGIFSSGRWTNDEPPPGEHDIRHIVAFEVSGKRYLALEHAIKNDGWMFLVDASGNVDCGFHVKMKSYNRKLRSHKRDELEMAEASRRAGPEMAFWSQWALGDAKAK